MRYVHGSNSSFKNKNYGWYHLTIWIESEVRAAEQSSSAELYYAYLIFVFIYVV